MKVRRCGYGLAVMLAVIALSTTTVFAKGRETKEDMNIQEKDLMVNPGGTADGESVLPSREKLTEVDTGKSGKITVRLAEGKEGVAGAGVRFCCVKVADIANGEYVLEERYQDCGVDLNHIENSAGMEEAALGLAGLVEMADVEQAETGQSGEAVFTKLGTGVYLVMAEDNPAYDTVCPALVSIPLWDESKGEMCYETVIEPKHTPRPEEPGKEEEPETGAQLRGAPQTGIKDNTAGYLIAAAICFSGVCLLGLSAGMSKRGKKK